MKLILAEKKNFEHSKVTDSFIIPAGLYKILFKLSTATMSTIEKDKV